MFEWLSQRNLGFHAIVIKTPPLRSPPATNSSGGVLKILAHGPICVGGVSKILRNSPIWPRGVSKILEQTYPKFIKNTVFQGKNSQNFPRASRARRPKIPKFPQFAWRGFKNFRLRRNLRWRGFKNSGPRTYWWWRGLQRGGFNNNSVVVYFIPQSLYWRVWNYACHVLLWALYRNV